MMMVIFRREARIIMCKEMYLVSIISIKEVFVGPVVLPRWDFLFCFSAGDFGGITVTAAMAMVLSYSSSCFTGII